MITLSSSEAGAVWLIAVVVAVHAALFGLPFINLEWAFSDAARYFALRDDRYLERYFHVQANTLGIPFLAFALHKFAPFVDIGYFPRLLAVSGFIFMGAALLRLNRLLGSRVHPVILLAAVFLCPLVWTFGGRGTADFLPASLALLGVVLFWEKPQGIARLGIASAVFSIAIVLKYHAVVLLPLIWLEALTRPQGSLRETAVRMSAVTVAILLPPLCYLLAMKHNFGFWVAPPLFHDPLSATFDAASIVENFSAYSAHLILQAFPLSVFVLLQQIRTPRDFSLLAGLAAVLFLLGFFFLDSHGEMNFGPLDPYLDPRLLNGMFLASLCLFLPLARGVRNALPVSSESERLGWCYVAGAIIFFGVLSVSRPTQRYLLFILPMAFPFILPALRQRTGLIGVTLAFYLAINLYIGFNQYATGRAAIELTDKIAAADLLAVTDPGMLAGHTGNRFPLRVPGTGKYTVVAGQSPRQILSAESRPVPFIRKNFSVVPIE